MDFIVCITMEKRLNYLRHTNEIFACRKESLERVFADAKECDGLPYGIKNKFIQVTLTFSAMNLNKLANWTWQLA